MKRFIIAALVVLAAGMIMASTAAKDLYVPAASRALGAFGTDWRSDVRAYNPNTATANVAITYLPMAAFAGQAATINVTIAPLHTAVWENIMEENFGLQPNTAGALHFVSNLDIYVESRIWTPGAEGTFGQRVPGIPATQAVAAGESVDILYVDNLSTADGFRTNFGLVDAGGVGVAYALSAYDQNGTVLGTYNGTVAANQWDQFNALGKLGVAGDTQYARLMLTVTSGKAIPYASQADNASGDAMYIDGTKIKSSGNGGDATCGTGTYYGYYTQYNNGDWEGFISNPGIWAIDNFNVWSMQDPTPEDPNNEDDWGAIYILPTNSVIWLGFSYTAETPEDYITLSDGAPFDFSIQFTYTSGGKNVLDATWHWVGTMECNYIHGDMDALVKALDSAFKAYAGKWYWHFAAGLK